MVILLIQCLAINVHYFVPASLQELHKVPVADPYCCSVGVGVKSQYGLILNAGIYHDFNVMILVVDEAERRH